MVKPRIALGCVTFGREIGEDESFRILDSAFERGVRLFDTAEVYGGGASERILGKWLRRTGVRAQVEVQTKAGVKFTAEGIRNSLAGSLDRLGTDYVDLYLFHRLDASVPVVECVGAMRQDAVRATGCSNVSAECLRDAVAQLRAAGLPAFAMVQPPWNLLQRGIESELLPFCSAEGIPVVTYSPLAAGFLSGKYTADRNAAPAGSRFATIPGHMDVYFSPRNFAVVEKLHRFAAAVGVPPLQLAFAWALQNHGIAAVLTGATRLAHLDNAFAAANLSMREEWMTEMNSWGAGNLT